MAAAKKLLEMKIAMTLDVDELIRFGFIDCQLIIGNFLLRLLVNAIFLNR